MKKIAVIFMLLLFPLLSCVAKEEVDRDMKESIGVATMMDDGTIVLHLRAETGSILGNARFEYKPTDPEYENVRKHLGGITPGEEKQVPPWPEEKEYWDQ